MKEIEKESATFSVGPVVSKHLLLQSALLGWGKW